MISAAPRTPRGSHKHQAVWPPTRTRAIRERLGHGTIQVTLGTYGHVFPSFEESLTAALDNVYRTAETAPPAEVRNLSG
jgi:hypothetical protein